MTNNAIESWNNEFYNLLGRRAHPNPYFFGSTIKRALAINSKILRWVDKGDHLEVISRTARNAITKRNRLKIKFVQDLDLAQSEEERRQARVKYMKTTGSTNTRIMAKGKKKIARQKKEESCNEAETIPTGRPSYQRIRAAESKKCRFCGKVLKSKSGAKNHEKICKKRILSEANMKCKYCSKPYKVRFYLTQHEKNCKVNVNAKDDSSEDESLDERLLLSEEESLNDSPNESLSEEELPNNSSNESLAEDEEKSTILKRISTEILETEDKSKMAMLLDKIEELYANVQDYETTGAGFILRIKSQYTRGFLGLRITKMYQKLLRNGMKQEKFSHEYSSDEDEISSSNNRRKSKRLKGM